MLNHVGTQQQETSHLILRRHEMTDADDMYRNWVADPEVSRFWSWEPHKSIDETKSLLAGWIEEYTEFNYYHWIIVLKNISQAVGYIYFADIDDVKNSISVHFALSRKFWNQGIMTEALNCVLEFAFSVLGAEKVHTRHHIDNPASGRVQQKCGMRYVKTQYERMTECERLSGDYCCYEIVPLDRKRVE